MLSSSLNLKSWVLAARPKTLVVSLIPVLVGSCLASAVSGSIEKWIPLCAFLSAVFIQIGTNFINDGIDFEKGADTEKRLGPRRMTQSGVFRAEQVKRAGLMCFVFSIALGIPLVVKGGFPIVIIGIISVICGYVYTGGPYPLAYKGLGDLFVLLFYGFVAVAGMYQLHLGTLLTVPVLVAGLQVGLHATALIAINNLRDRKQDLLVNKRTLAVRIGEKAAKIEIAICLLAPFIISLYWIQLEKYWAVILPQVALVIAIPLVKKVFNTEPPSVYNSFLAKAAAVQLVAVLMLSLGLSIGR